MKAIRNPMETKILKDLMMNIHMNMMKMKVAIKVIMVINLFSRKKNMLSKITLKLKN